MKRCLSGGDLLTAQSAFICTGRAARLSARCGTKRFKALFPAKLTHPERSCAIRHGSSFLHTSERREPRNIPPQPMMQEPRLTPPPPPSALISSNIAIYRSLGQRVRDTQRAPTHFLSSLISPHMTTLAQRVLSTSWACSQSREQRRRGRIRISEGRRHRRSVRTFPQRSDGVFS